MQSLCIISIIIVALTISNCQPQYSKKVLAIYFNNVPAFTSDVSSVISEFSSRIALAFNLTKEEIVFSETVTQPTANDEGSYLPFSVFGANVNVTDSESTSVSYTKYSELWRVALLKSDNIVNSFFFESVGDVSVDIHRYEAERDIKSSSQRNQLVSAMKSLEKVMQLRLKNANLEDYKKSWSLFNSLIGGTRSLVASILDVPLNTVIFYNIKPGSVVAQFTIYPAETDVNSLNQKWATAVANKHDEISTYFNDFDYEYPAIGFTSAVTQSSAFTTKVPDGAKIPHAAVVAGAVIGGLAGVALLGGGIAACLHSRRRKNEAPKIKSENLASTSPGGRFGTPNALSNIQIHGEVTPNPHNY